MFVTHLAAKNWRNFKAVEFELRERQFLVGPNAAGKSNLLDMLRFLRDIALREGGGLQKAIRQRGGVSKIRSLAARRDPEILIEIRLSETPDAPAKWRYELAFKQESRGRRQTLLTRENVWRDGRKLLTRPDPDDLKDPERLTQTHLEQIHVNVDFRPIAQFLESVTYLHLVPQLLRFADSIQGRILENDPFGQGFLERIAKAPENTRKARLRRIEDALKVAVPQLQKLAFLRDENTGQPHLQALYSHWRPNAGWQREDQFSDGTLRLLGLLWSLQENDSLLLLEEPELSLNAGIVAHLAPLIHRMQRVRSRQVLVSTHSEALLSDPGIDGREVLLLSPGAEGTEVAVSSDFAEVRALLEEGMTVGEVVLARTKPSNAHELGSVT
ncbi:MAG: AAA family ATPase [Polyangiaceae bacterium]|nr:AAA family ATPase [Polyangiaceae bacterium]